MKLLRRQSTSPPRTEVPARPATPAAAKPAAAPEPITPASERAAPVGTGPVDEQRAAKHAGALQRLRGAALWATHAPSRAVARFTDLEKRAVKAERDVTAALVSCREPDEKSLDRLIDTIDKFDDRREALFELKGNSDLGTVNPDVPRGRAALSEPQRAALGRFLTVFQSPSALHIEPGVLGEGVTPASPRALLALTEAFRSPYSSVDPNGAANVDHVGSVFRGVLQQEATRLGRPLEQHEVDRLAFNTVLTDVWMKGRSLDELLDVPTAPTQAGSTVREIDVQIKARAKQAFDAPRDGQVPDERIRDVVHGWIDKASMPMDPDGVRQAGRDAGLTEPQTEALVSAWQERILDSGDWVNVQGFMRGVLLHGLVGFEAVERVVKSSGENLDPRSVYMSTVGHHMAVFVAAGLGKGAVRPKFDQMEAQGALPPGGAAKLEKLYTNGMRLSAKWQRVISEAQQRHAGLTGEQRREFRAEAAELRSAIRALPEDVRSQLLNDDLFQFTPQAIEKWLRMQPAPDNGAAIVGAYECAQGYLEDALARDLDAPGHDFVQYSALCAERLGVTLDPDTLVYRPAVPGEPPFTELAARLAKDPELSARFVADGNVLANASGQQLVDWFRAQPTDMPALVRLAQD